MAWNTATMIARLKYSLTAAIYLYLTSALPYKLRKAHGNWPVKSPGKPIRGMIISLPAERTRPCQVLERGKVAQSCGTGKSGTRFC